MFERIMVPVVLDQVERMERTLRAAADLAREYDASVTYVAVSGTVPNAVASTPEKFAAELDMFAREQGSAAGISTRALSITCNDPGAELEKRLLEAVESTDADLVVMGSHKPGVADALHLIGSHAAWLVRHSDVSVFVIR
jgi:nucleotide-binding universal stress UspA family protein